MKTRKIEDSTNMIYKKLSVGNKGSGEDATVYLFLRLTEPLTLSVIVYPRAI